MMTTTLKVEPVTEKTEDPTTATSTQVPTTTTARIEPEQPASVTPESEQPESTSTLATLTTKLEEVSKGPSDGEDAEMATDATLKYEAFNAVQPETDIDAVKVNYVMI